VSINHPGQQTPYSNIHFDDLQAVEKLIYPSVFVMLAKAGIQELVDFTKPGFSGHRPSPV
jgi:hypothetical protein